MKKREYILSINPCIYGLNYHDPGAAIISDGEILFAIEEERLNGIKGSKGVFPELSFHCNTFLNISFSWENAIITMMNTCKNIIKRQTRIILKFILK